MKSTTTTMLEQKLKKDKITMLTVYDYSTARLMDSCGVEALLVGDSLGMVMLGYNSTLPVTMEDMIHHSKAVVRGSENAMVVGDLPFMSYQTSVRDAVINAGRMVKEAGVYAVKLEGGKEMCPQIKGISNASIPVMAHLGLTPQSINKFGGFKVQGRDKVQAEKLIEDALAVEEAGAFAVVLECIPAELAALITSILKIPTIGIGAGADCDGQVLVYQDMLSIYSGITPKFVKQFGDVGNAMKQAFQEYIKETKQGSFPGEEHTYKIKRETMEELRQEWGNI